MNYLNKKVWKQFCNKYQNPKRTQMGIFNNIGLDRLNFEENTFANNFLLPEKAFIASFLKNTCDNEVNIEEMSNQFKVDNKHIYWRGIVLSLWY